MHSSALVLLPLMLTLQGAYHFLCLFLPLSITSSCLSFHSSSFPCSSPLSSSLLSPLCQLHILSSSFFFHVTCTNLHTAASAQFSQSPPAEVLVNASETAVVTCAYPNASSISWVKGTSPITSDSPGFTVDIFPSGSDGSTLMLHNTTVAVHGGSYACVAVIAGVEARTNFSVTVACEWLIC